MIIMAIKKKIQKSRLIGLLWRMTRKPSLRSYFVKICSVPDGGIRRVTVKTLAVMPGEFENKECDQNS